MTDWQYVYWNEKVTDWKYVGWQNKETDWQYVKWQEQNSVSPDLKYRFNPRFG